MLQPVPHWACVVNLSHGKLRLWRVQGGVSDDAAADASLLRLGLVAVGLWVRGSVGQTDRGSVCLWVRGSVGPSVGRSVGPLVNRSLGLGSLGFWVFGLGS